MFVNMKNKKIQLMWGEDPDKPLALKMFRADFLLGMQDRKNHLDVDVTWMNGLREKLLAKMT